MMKLYNMKLNNKTNFCKFKNVKLKNKNNKNISLNCLPTFDSILKNEFKLNV